MELQGKDIVVLGTTKFDNPYESTSYTISKYLAQNNRVFYIENPFTWKDYLYYKGKNELNIRKGLFSWSSDGLLSTEIPGLKIVITPFLLSINFLPEGRLYRALLKVNEAIIKARIKKLLHNNCIRKEFVFINSFTFHYPDVATSFKPKLAVYHCVDAIITPFDKKHGFISERQLISNSDLIVCTSKQLYSEKKLLSKHSYFIPNAADISHSSKALDSNLKPHSSIALAPKPVIGYFGNIERRIDFELLKVVILDNPDKSFVFVGPYDPDFIPEWYHSTPNVTSTGRLPYEDLPAVLKAFDIAIIPFKKDEVSNTIFPLKLFEYLGAGKPVICTDFNPDLAEFTKGTVRFCADSTSFSKAIKEELEDDSSEKIAKRIQVANENTWSKRAGEFSALLQSYLQC
jgi:glycosyltransferase involved in cell wall biosynthesis